MVPLIWAFFSADVNAGTASAARIAIIAITTSNSMSVNAEEGLFIFIFILGFLFCGCSEGFSQRGFGFYSGVSVLGWSEGFGLGMKGGLSQSSQIKSIIIFNFFGGAFMDTNEHELGSARALACWFRRPRRNDLCSNQESTANNLPLFSPGFAGRSSQKSFPISQPAATDDTDGGCSHGAVRRPRRVAPKQVNAPQGRGYRVLFSCAASFQLVSTESTGPSSQKSFPISEESNHEWTRMR